MVNKKKQFSCFKTSSKKQLKSVKGTCKGSGKINYKDFFFEFMTEILLARIKCQSLLCEHDNETSGFVDGKEFIDCVTESEGNLKI